VSTTASTITILAALIGLIGVQTVWVAHMLGVVGQRIDSLERRLDRIEARLDDMFRVLLEHGERIAKLEESAP